MLAILVAVSACAPIEVRGTAPRAQMTIRVEASGDASVVRVPEDRPGGGIDVRRTNGRTFRIPPGHYPPPGECRIWRPGVPPGHQDPPGACDILRQQVPPGAVLIEG